jgi:hypothetical protein
VADVDKGGDAPHLDTDHWRRYTLDDEANITGSNLVHHRDVITTSGTYTAPVTGLYKITVKGGGGGGSGAWAIAQNTKRTGTGGGEGGTTIGYEKMTAGQTASVVIGAGGSGGAVGAVGTTGGNSQVDVNGITLSATGGHNGGEAIGGSGGDGTIGGADGGAGQLVASSYTTMMLAGGLGGGNGTGKGGSGGNWGPGSGGTALSGNAGSNGGVIFEYMAPA